MGLCSSEMTDKKWEPESKVGIHYVWYFPVLYCTIITIIPYWLKNVYKKMWEVRIVPQLPTDIWVCWFNCDCDTWLAITVLSFQRWMGICIILCSLQNCNLSLTCICNLLTAWSAAPGCLFSSSSLVCLYSDGVTKRRLIEEWWKEKGGEDLRKIIRTKVEK